MELNLNDKQQEAINYTEGPLLILAGAGSGKTRVITHRIAHLINSGVNAWNILAITFTNKAASEMRSRVDDTTDNNGSAVWVSTFHSLCVRILRRYIDAIGYTNNFTIYDSDDQKQIIKRIIKEQNLDPKMWKEKSVISKISSLKDKMISPDEYIVESSGDFREEIIARLYKQYEIELKSSNALDFDDLLNKTVELFEKESEVLNYYQERFKYIMVDEYQDTNTVQFKLIELLSKKYKNLCVVGDDDQSIYRFRGADIRNILNFEKVFPNTKVIKLEQNYRSTSQILDSANAVISNNRGRKEKRLWTSKVDGEQVRFKWFDTGYNEAEFVIDEISKLARLSKASFQDFAILYRTNAQSRLFEEKCVKENVPYKLIGGVNFYARKEIKDILAYLKTIDNGADDLSVRRIINVPRRGIGNTTIQKILQYAFENNFSFFEAIQQCEDSPALTKSSSKIKDFTNIILDIRDFARNHDSVLEIIDKVLDKTGYVEELKIEGSDEALARIENIEELRSKAMTFDENPSVQEESEGELSEDNRSTLSKFLEEVALIADIDSLDDSENRIVLMTLHGSKGLEFPYVYMVGMEEKLFPSYMAIESGDNDDIEEERRLCYVGITRAKEHLMLSGANSRILHGQNQYNEMSRFVKEIPKEYFDEDNGFGRKDFLGFDDDFDNEIHFEGGSYFDE